MLKQLLVLALSFNAVLAVALPGGGKHKKPSHDDNKNNNNNGGGGGGGGKDKDDDYKSGSPALIFEKSSYEVADGSAGVEVGVRLATAPSSAATVYFELPGLKLSSCSLKFTRDNWRSVQKFKVIPGANIESSSYTLRAKVVSPRSAYDGYEGKVAVTRKSRPSSRCAASGDPHYRTFDGKYYSYQGEGVFWLVNSPHLGIQADQMRCGKGVTCIRAVAIQYGTSVISINPKPNTNNELELRLISKTAPGIEAICSKERNQYQLRIADGTQMTVRIQPWNKVYYLDVTIDSSGSIFGKTKGLCGNYNSNKGDDGLKPEEHRVDNAYSIFHTGRGVSLAEPPVAATPCICKIPAAAPAETDDGVDKTAVVVPGWEVFKIETQVTNAVNLYLSGALTYSRNRDAIDVGVKTVAVPAQVAAQICGNVLATLDDWCTANVDTQYYTGTCAADLVNTGDMRIVTHAAQAMLTACAGRLTYGAGYEAAGEAARQMVEKASKVYQKCVEVSTQVVSLSGYF
ncbi:hypothetical protein HDU96_010326 [Phlyctochytrium bullatum]|nr:hypothetical protein HDU96_010326 [Phlyctochytrium bullatum]